MQETETLIKKVETLTASFSALSEESRKEKEAHRKEVESLHARIKELTAQVAWLNRQLYGRKSEKLPIIDPNYPDMFAAEFGDLLKQAEEKRDEAVGQLPKEDKQTARQKRQVRKMLEDLPVLVQVRLRPDGIDETLYKKIGEEVTRIVEHEPGRLYIKEIIREKWGLKDNTQLPPSGMPSVLVATMPLLPIYKGIAGPTLLSEILLQKYEYHMPYYRQIQQYRHLG